MASDTWGQTEHLFCIILHFILLTEEGKKLSTSQPWVACADGVQANMLLPSQLYALFAAVSVGVCPTTERQSHLQPLQVCKAELSDRALCSVSTAPLIFRGMVGYWSVSKCTRS